MTKKQNEIWQLSKRLRPLTDKQKDYAIKTTFAGWAAVADKTTCMDCGARMKNGEGKYIYCPICGTKKKVFRNRCSKRSVMYHQKLQVVEGYQVVRTFAVRAFYYKASEKPTFLVDECVQNWIDEKGGETIMALPMKFMPRYLDDFNFYEEMKPKRRPSYWKTGRYSLYSDSYAKGHKLLPKVIKHGFQIRFHDIPVNEYIKLLISDNDFEYLAKTGQESMMVEYYKRAWNNLKDYKRELNICHRNRYVISDAVLWKDMIDALKAVGKDTLNPKYVCPEDLRMMHDYAIRLKLKADERRTIAERMKDARDAENDYKEAKKAYFGICFNDGDIYVSVIDSVIGILQEGAAMHHCVYTNGYYKKRNVLIMSAKDRNGNRLETVEIDLSTFRIVQSRGLMNSTTDKHENIIRLVEKNMDLIRKAV